MFNYILQILGIEISDNRIRYTNGIVCSWGPRDFRPLLSKEGEEIGCIFGVEGYKHKGDVIIKYIPGLDLFEISLRKGYGFKNGKITHKEGRVYLDQIVSLIDQLVEHTEDYEARVKKQYKNLII